MKNDNSTRVNAGIRATSVNLIDASGNRLGDMSLSQALRKAEEAGLDLVQVSADGEKPVCKIMNFDKFRFEQQKKDKQPPPQKNKEVQLTPQIAEHDLEVKTRQVQTFISEGHKVRIVMKFRGREFNNLETSGRAKMVSLAEKAGAAFDKSLERNGNSLSMTLVKNK